MDCERPLSVNCLMSVKQCTGFESWKLRGLRDVNLSPIHECSLKSNSSHGCTARKYKRFQY